MGVTILHSHVKKVPFCVTFRPASIDLLFHRYCVDKCLSKCAVRVSVKLVIDRFASVGIVIDIHSSMLIMFILFLLYDFVRNVDILIYLFV